MYIYSHNIKTLHIKALRWRKGLHVFDFAVAGLIPASCKYFFLCYLTHDKNREFRWYVSNLLGFFFKFSFLILSISISNINRSLHWNYTLFTQIHPLLIARRYHSSKYQLAYTQSSIYIFFRCRFLKYMTNQLLQTPL